VIVALAKEEQLVEMEMMSSLTERLPRETIFARVYWTAHKWPQMTWGIAGKVLLISSDLVRDWSFAELVPDQIKDVEGGEIAVPKGLDGRCASIRTDPRSTLKYVPRRKSVSELVRQPEHALVLCYFPGIERLPEEKNEIAALFLEVERELAFWESYVTALFDCVFRESVSPVTPAVCRTPDDTGAAELSLTASFHTGHERGAITLEEMQAGLGQLDKALREEPEPETLRLSLHWYGRAISESVRADQFLFYYIAYEVLAGEKKGRTNHGHFRKELFEVLSMDTGGTSKAATTLREIKDRRNDLVHRGDQDSPFPTQTLKRCVRTVLLKRLRLDEDQEVLSGLRTDLLRGTP